ncbi:25377_t:CDS:2, partial [Gigaspora margarita]
HAQNFATLVNTSVAIKKMVYQTFKNIIPHMNCKAIELDLTRGYNTLQTLCHLVGGWLDPRFNTRINAINNLAKDPNFYTILSGLYATENQSVYMNDQNIEDESNDVTIVCHNKNFIDISLSGKWNNNKVKGMSLSKNLNIKNPFFQDLYKAYDNYLNSKAALINKRLEFYNLIMYTVLEDNQDLVWVKLKVSGFVKLL